MIPSLTKLHQNKSSQDERAEAFKKGLADYSWQFGSIQEARNFDYPRVPLDLNEDAWKSFADKPKMPVFKIMIAFAEPFAEGAPPPIMILTSQNGVLGNRSFRRKSRHCWAAKKSGK